MTGTGTRQRISIDRSLRLGKDADFQPTSLRIFNTSSAKPAPLHRGRELTGRVSACRRRDTIRTGNRPPNQRQTSLRSGRRQRRATSRAHAAPLQMAPMRRWSALQMQQATRTIRSRQIGRGSCTHLSIACILTGPTASSWAAARSATI